MTAEPLYRSSRLAPMPPTYDDKSDRSSIISTATTLNSADMPRPAFLSAFGDEHRRASAISLNEDEYGWSGAASGIHEKNRRVKKGSTGRVEVHERPDAKVASNDPLSGVPLLGKNSSPLAREPTIEDVPANEGTFSKLVRKISRKSSTKKPALRQRSASFDSWTTAEIGRVPTAVELDKIKLYVAPESANVKDAPALSSYAPRASLQDLVSGQSKPTRSITVRQARLNYSKSMGNKADRRSRLAAEPSEATLNRRSARQSRVPQGWAAAPKNEVVEKQ